MRVNTERQRNRGENTQGETENVRDHTEGDDGGKTQIGEDVERCDVGIQVRQREKGEQKNSQERDEEEDSKGKRRGEKRKTLRERLKERYSGERGETAGETNRKIQKD